ncbi:MAG: CU044_2847 family protein [Proteobacteria bacterium]|jgi:hypothetical protein|nr:CU044_2847 family protein [Pseudomonadota bacterium]
MNKLKTSFGGIDLYITPSSTPIQDQYPGEELTGGERKNPSRILEANGEEMAKKLVQLCTGIASNITSGLQSVTPKEFEISFSIGFDGKANFVLGELGASSGLQVTMKF